MKRALLLTMVLLSMLRVAADSATPPKELRFRDLYDREVTLKGDEATRAWVLFFFSNTCPVARRYMPRIAQLENEYGARGVRFIGVNASPADTLLDIAAFARDFDVSYPVLKDDTFSSAKALGITRTPEVAVLGKDLVAVYHGRIDDQYRLGGIRPTATRHDLKDALDALLAGQPASASHVPAEGCAITLPDAVASSPDADDGYKESDMVFTHELRLDGAGEAGDIPGTREWELVPTIAEDIWVNAIQVKGPSHGASLFYLDPEVPGKRHYVAGALESEQPVQWNSDEGLRLPGGTRLRLSLSERSNSDLSVRLRLLESPPAREVFCSRETATIGGGHPEVPQLTQVLPARAALRCVAVDFSGYGASLVIEQVGLNQTTSTLLSFPILDPARPATSCMTESHLQTDSTNRVRATLHFPEYLRTPLPETPMPGSTGDADDSSLSIFLYWTLPR